MKGVKLVLSRVLLAVMIVVQVFGTTSISKVQASTSKNLESVIVSGGTFDTGIRINQNYSAELTFSLSTLNQYKNLYVAAGSKYNVYRMRYEANSGLFAAHGWYNQKVYVPKVNEEITIANKKNVIYVNGSKVLTETYQNIDAVSNLKFGDLVGSIKSFRVWNESNTLVASYIPVLDESGKACMYDAVNKKYVYYSGTCQAGKVIVDETPTVPDVSDQTETSGTEEKNDAYSDASIQYVEALELNSGSFNTGILINQDYSIEMIFSLADTTQYKDLYSAANSKYNVYKLRSEAANGLYATHGWYNTKIYTPKANEEIKISQKKNVTYINDKQVLKMTYQQLQATSALKFGNFKGTIKSFKVWNASGKLVGEYLPAVDESGKACMYDTVNKKYVYYSGTCKAVVAEEEEVEEEEKELDNGLSNDSDNTSSDAMENSNSQAVYDLLEKAMLQSDASKFDISKYKLSVDEVQNVIWKKVINDNYLEYLAQVSIRVCVTSKNGYAYQCYLLNINADYENCLKKVKASVNKYLEQVDNKMTDVEKVLLAHEFIVDNTEYKAANSASGWAAGPLSDGYGICAGYSGAMIALLHCVGIDAYNVVGQGMNHGWIYVKLDGEYYHIDPTWDDTQKGTNAVYQHRFLLRNDDEFSTISAARVHSNWYSYEIEDVNCSSQRFTNWYVHDVAGTMCYYNGMWYYRDVKTNSIKCANISGSVQKVVVDGATVSGTVKIKGIEDGVLSYYVGSTLCTKNL